ncbi:hypothetical protein G7046_g8895 [Stylonectria norvegica]|nr:hypothetical protein G7046_g8895 [Stylonectria norvegica]
MPRSNFSLTTPSELNNSTITTSVRVVHVGMDALQETVQETARVVTSKPVQRAVVHTVLFVSSVVTLFCFAAVASALFFQNFVPDQVVTRPVHLQYGSGLNPYAIASLTAPPMKSQQEYDISVTLSMPRSPPNVDRGNFMISLHLLDSKADNQLEMSARQYAFAHDGFGEHKVLFSSRRPVLIPYVDPVISLASRVLFLFYHMFAPGSSTCTMIIPLAERVKFSKSSTIPSAAYIEVEAGQTVQIYYAALSLTAQLRGLRWLMFHYRFPTYIAFTFLFWVFELIFMSVAWAVSGSALGDAGKRQRLEKSHDGLYKDEAEEEREQLSDVPETFPTYGKQQPLKYEPAIKRELEVERPISEVPVGGAEADDEEDYDDEEDEYRKGRDSGLGTSYNSVILPSPLTPSIPVPFSARSPTVTAPKSPATACDSSRFQLHTLPCRASNSRPSPHPVVCPVNLQQGSRSSPSTGACPRERLSVVTASGHLRAPDIHGAHGQLLRS